MPLILRQQKGSKLTIQEMDGNLVYVNNLTEVTYAQLTNLSGSQQLVPGQHYLITDFRTCYDRPDYSQDRNPIAVSEISYVEGDIDPIVVLATANDRLSIDAYQPSYPYDTIKYDPEYSQTESGGPAFGRITERVDERGNRADYDHRVITFKRYQLITYNKRNPLEGNVDLGSNGEVIGTDTVFTNLLPGDVIAISNSNETFYKIVTITNDTTMTVTGETITATGSSGNLFYSASLNSYDSYYPNNVDGQDNFELYNTFEADISGDGCINTYIGDHSKYFLNGYSGDFLLANNVLKDGSYQNNIIGDSSYNNTFNDDCTSNKIGFAFRNNITDDDIDGNVIGDFCQDNIITANLQYNQIGRNFENNIILCNSFYRNRIGNDFRDNWLDGDWGFDFQNNQIGNGFNNNDIYKAFYKNVILNGYNNNETWEEVQGNQIGNGFNQNDIYSQFYDNVIGDYFQGNTLSALYTGTHNFNNNRIGYSYENNTIVGNFFKNEIANNFSSNIIQDNFAYNKIGSEFQGNTIDVDFGFGGSQARGNTIGNVFVGNTIGEYFYDNTICDNFQSNIILNDFRFNNVAYPTGGTDFTLATHVYGDYNCKILRGSNTNGYLEYFDGTSLQYVSITA